MKTIISSSNISILVNGSLTSEFLASRGLKQGDPLSPFLFLIVDQGMMWLVHSAVEKGLFKGLKVGEEFQYSILQYANDSILVGEAIHDNLWAIKETFKGFELVSRLSVNFYKSVFYGLAQTKDLMRQLQISFHAGLIPHLFTFWDCRLGLVQLSLQLGNQLLSSFGNDS